MDKISLGDYVKLLETNRGRVTRHKLAKVTEGSEKKPSGGKERGKEKERMEGIGKKRKKREKKEGKKRKKKEKEEKERRGEIREKKLKLKRLKKISDNESGEEYKPDEASEDHFSEHDDDPQQIQKEKEVWIPIKQRVIKKDIADDEEEKCKEAADHGKHGEQQEDKEHDGEGIGRERNLEAHDADIEVPHVDLSFPLDSDSLSLLQHFYTETLFNASLLHGRLILFKPKTHTDTQHQHQLPMSDTEDIKFTDFQIARVLKLNDNGKYHLQILSNHNSLTEEMHSSSQYSDVDVRKHRSYVIANIAWKLHQRDKTDLFTLVALLHNIGITSIHDLDFLQESSTDNHVSHQSEELVFEEEEESNRNDNILTLNLLHYSFEW
jgi:hypothetical protein